MSSLSNILLQALWRYLITVSAITLLERPLDGLCDRFTIARRLRRRQL